MRVISRASQFAPGFPLLLMSASSSPFRACRRWTSSVPEKCQRLVPQLIACLGSAEFVHIADAVRRQYAHDESHFTPALPDLVVQPSSTDQVSTVLRLAHQQSVPVVPFGTGTGLEGGVVAVKGGICLDLRRMDRVLELNEEDFDCTVEPGVTRQALNRHIRDSGLWFTVDPGADASICGMIATGASGTTSVRYGTMKGNVRNLEVVLADGTVLHTRGRGRRPWKSSAGYNLTELFVGSEGTLGVITAATVLLHPRPATVGVAVCAFPSVRQAITAVQAIRQSGMPVARLEFLDDRQMEASLEANPELSALVAPAFSLFVELHGSTDAEIQRQCQQLEELCAANGGHRFQKSAEPESIQLLWKARHNAYYANLARRPGARAFITDACVPLSQLPRVLEQARLLVDQSGLFATIVGHVGEGNFHCMMPVFEEDSEEMGQVWALSEEIVRLALSADGTCTGEHGIGLGKREYLREELGEEPLRLMEMLKRQLDPNGIMNPGKLFPTAGG